MRNLIILNLNELTDRLQAFGFRRMHNSDDYVDYERSFHFYEGDQQLQRIERISLDLTRMDEIQVYGVIRHVDVSTGKEQYDYEVPAKAYSEQALHDVIYYFGRNYAKSTWKDPQPAQNYVMTGAAMSARIMAETIQDAINRLRIMASTPRSGENIPDICKSLEKALESYKCES